MFSVVLSPYPVVSVLATTQTDVEVAHQLVVSHTSTTPGGRPVSALAAVEVALLPVPPVKVSVPMLVPGVLLTEVLAVKVRACEVLSTEVHLAVVLTTQWESPSGQQWESPVGASVRHA